MEMYFPIFFLLTHRTSKSLSVMNWFFDFSLDIISCFHLSYNSCTGLTSITLKRQNERKKILKNFLLSYLFFTHWICNYGCVSKWLFFSPLNRPAYDMLQNQAEMLQLPGTTPVLSVLRAVFHCKDPVMGFLEALNSNSLWQMQMGFKSYIYYCTQTVWGISLFTSCYKWIFKCLHRFWTNCAK